MKRRNLKIQLPTVLYTEGVIGFEVLGVTGTVVDSAKSLRVSLGGEIRVDEANRGGMKLAEGVCGMMVAGRY